MSTEFVGLELEEIDEIIAANMMITDQRLYEGVFNIVVDIELALKEKNSGELVQQRAGATDDRHIAAIREQK